jgi:monovalent cation/hydrogen antiporter
MQSTYIHNLELLSLFLLGTVVALAALARRFQIPYPIIFVLGGLGISLLPGMPRVGLDPDVVFLVLLPPLVFAAAFHTSWRSFQRNFVAILTMATGLVGFTVVLVAEITGHILPGFDRRTGFVLGALVASTDAIAATAIVRRMGLPSRIADVLEGESLVNDVASLVALEFSVGIVISDHVPSMGEGVLRLLYISIVGILVGTIAGSAIRWMQRKLPDIHTEITLTLIAPYLAYLAAESLDSSGVLSTVVCGLLLGYRRPESPAAHRTIESSTVWSTLEFIFNGVVFVLIGLQLPYVAEGIRDIAPRELLIDAGLLCVLLIVLRLVWVFASAWAGYGARRTLGKEALRPNVAETFLTGWMGMRGVISLAAALSLPDLLESGAPFPQRSLLVFLSFCVILVTLVGQGLTSPSLIAKIGLSPATDLRDGQYGAEQENPS